MKKGISCYIFMIFTSILCLTQIACIDAKKGDYSIKNIKIYENTPAWELALAVRDQNSKKIQKISQRNPELLNYQDPKYGATLLLWAIGMEKYKSAEALLKAGADPEIASNEGITPLFLASGYSWVDIFAKKDPKYVELLLRFGANPNNCYSGFENPNFQSVIEVGTSPLMHSIGSGIEKTKALVRAGADINYKTKSGRTAAIVSLMRQGLVEYAYYLIAQQKANVAEPYYSVFNFENEEPKELYPVNLLRNWVFDLNSKEYKMKMEIVKEFARQGVDYWQTEIPKNKLEQIKKLYPDTWREYLQKY